MAGTWEDILYQSGTFSGPSGNEYMLYYGLQQESDRKQKLSFSITNGPRTSTLNQEFNIHITVYDNNLKNGQKVFTRNNFIASPYGYVENNNQYLNVENFEIDPLSDFSYFPNSAVLKYVLSVSDIKNTTTYREEQIYTIDLTYANDLAPTLTVGDPVVDNSSNASYKTPEGWGITQSISLFKFPYSYSLKKNATFKSMECKFGPYTTIETTRDTTNHTLNTTSPTNSSGKIVYTIVLTDSRNIRQSVNKIFTVNPYNSPEVKSVTANRCLADGTLDEDGEYILLKATYAADNRQANQITSILGAIIDKATGTTLDVNHPLTLKVNSTTDSLIQAESTDIIGAGEIDITKEYTVSASIFDKPGSLNHKWTSKTANIYRSYCTMDFLAGGKGIAFGTMASKEGFECNMDADFNNTVNVDGNLTVNGESRVGGTANFQSALYVNNGPSGFNGTLDINGTSRYPTNHQVYEGGGRKHLRLYPAGSKNKTYRIATTGKQTQSDLDSHLTLLVTSNHYVDWYKDYTGILNVVFRHYNDTRYASIVWLANDGWPTDCFTLAVGGTNGNMYADLWFTAPGVYDGLSVTVLDAGARYSTHNNSLFALRFDELYGGSYSSIPTSNPDGLGAYTAMKTAESTSGGLLYQNNYWGLTTPDRSNGSFLRTTNEGLIPFQSGGHSSLGTSSWPFNSVYTQHLYVGPANSVERVYDTIVAHGSSGIWNYRKWASGRAEVWGVHSVATGGTKQTWYNLYSSPQISLPNWPFTWSGTPRCYVSIRDNSQRYWSTKTYGGASTPPVICIIAPGPYDSETISVDVYAIGNWRTVNFNRI